MNLLHGANSINDLNKWNNLLNSARSWEQMVDHLLNWLSSQFFGAHCGYLQIQPDLQNKIFWHRENPTTNWLNTELAYQLFSVIEKKDIDEPLITKISSETPKLTSSISQFMQGFEISNIVLIPVFSQKDITGLFILGFQEHVPITVIENLQAAQILSIFLSNLSYWQSLYLETESKLKEMDQLFQIGIDLTASMNLEDTLNTILETALTITPDANDAHIFLFENEEMVFGAAMFQNGTSGKIWSQPRKNGLTYTVAQSGKRLVVNDMSAHTLFSDIKSWEGSIIGLPILHNQDVVGVMTMAKLVPVGFSDSQINKLEQLANQAANVIHNIRNYDRISQEAFTDPLTKLPNRRAFERESQKVLDHSERYKHQFVIAMLDLNGFKRINDSFGHTTGDKALHTIANCIKSMVRKTDLLARYGGDEFIILLPETDLESACGVMKKIMENVAACPILVSEQATESLTISYGLSLYPDNSENIDTLIAIADQALYIHKESRR